MCGYFKSVSHALPFTNKLTCFAFWAICCYLSACVVNSYWSKGCVLSEIKLCSAIKFYKSQQMTLFNSECYCRLISWAKFGQTFGRKNNFIRPNTHFGPPSWNTRMIFGLNHSFLSKLSYLSDSLLSRNRICMQIIEKYDAVVYVHKSRLNFCVIVHKNILSQFVKLNLMQMTFWIIYREIYCARVSYVSETWCPRQLFMNRTWGFHSITIAYYQHAFSLCRLEILEAS